MSDVTDPNAPRTIAVDSQVLIETLNSRVENLTREVVIADARAGTAEKQRDALATQLKDLQVEYISILGNPALYAQRREERQSEEDAEFSVALLGDETVEEPPAETDG